MLSLNRLHRFNLINYDHNVAQCVNETIAKFYRTSLPLQVELLVRVDHVELLVCVEGH